MPDLRMIFRKMMLALFILLFGLGICVGTLGNLQHKSYAAALFLGILLLPLGYLFRNRLCAWSDRLNKTKPVGPALVLMIACLLINGMIVICFHPVQAADYRTFFQTAVDLANGQRPQLRSYIALFPHILGYSAFLSMFLRLFGQSILTAGMLNVFLTTASGLMIFILCRRWLDTSSAAAAFALWIICPSKLLYNTMSLSEPYYTALILLFFLIVSNQEKTKKDSLARTAIMGICAGVVLGLVNTARPIGIIPIIASILWLFFLADGSELRNGWKKWLVFFTVLLAAYGLSGELWERYETEQLEQKPASVPGYSIYVGFNPETRGSYSDSDMDLLQNRYYSEYGQNAYAVQIKMMDDAKIRIREGAGGLPFLMLHKLGMLLGHDEGGVFYAKESMSETAYSLLCIISNLWYYTICILTMIGCIRLWQSRESGSLLLIPLFSLVLILAQLLVEVAARYHYALIPMLTILAAICVKNIRKYAVLA